MVRIGSDWYLLAEVGSALAIVVSVLASRLSVSLAWFRLGYLGFRQSLSSSGACRASLASGHLFGPSAIKSLTSLDGQIQSEIIVLDGLPQTADRILRDHIPSSTPPLSGTSGICSGERLRFIPRGLLLDAFVGNAFGCAAVTTRRSADVSPSTRSLKNARIANADEPCSS